MSYFRELLANWRAVLGATMGLAAGFSAANYVTSIMAQHMIAEFGCRAPNLPLLAAWLW
jgi:hypothetical protein